MNYLQQTGSASAYRSAVPTACTSGSPQCPLSLVLTGIARRADGVAGSGLSFGKVCTNYTTPACGGTYAYPAFPFAGPDVTGGVGPGGYAVDMPAMVAWKNLPYDTNYGTTKTINSASYNSGTKTETVGISVAWIAEPKGMFNLTSSGCDGTYQATASTTTSLSFASASDPGCSGSGTLKGPMIRKHRAAHGRH